MYIVEKKGFNLCRPAHIFYLFERNTYETKEPTYTLKIQLFLVYISFLNFYSNVKSESAVVYVVACVARSAIPDGRQRKLACFAAQRWFLNFVRSSASETMFGWYHSSEASSSASQHNYRAYICICVYIHFNKE